MTWEEVDLEARLWTIPAARMKGGVTHRVPLTDEMVRVLESVRPLGGAFVFRGQGRGKTPEERARGKPLSNMSMLMLLRRMGREQFTVHGFRSSFRDWAGEEAGVAREVAEAALAHQVGSDVERAYARSDLLERRRELMGKWELAVSFGRVWRG